MNRDEEEEASDAGVPSPGASAADLSALDRRTIVDDTGNGHGYDLAQRIHLPLSGYIVCRFCTGGPETCFLKEVQFEEHVNKKHPRHRAVWVCAACHKEFDKLHGWQCHKPHCKNIIYDESAEGELGEKCHTCGRAFRTLRGLAQHERHQHPEVRNLKRMELATSGRNGPGNRASAWSREEVDLLIQLDRRFHNEKYPNVKIREYLPHKTCRQISDKRRLLPARGRTVIEADDSSSGSSLYESANEEIEEAPRRSIGRERWETILQEAIKRNHLREEHPLRNIEKRIENMADWRRILPADVEEILKAFTEELYADVRQDPNVRGRAAQGKNKSRSSKGAPGFSDKTKHKRYLFARAQEMYKKCPQRLVDWAIVGEQPTTRGEIQTPEKEEIGSLYRDLWGVAGPQIKLKRRRSEVSSCPTEQVWTPITLEEMVSKFKRIKNNTAAGVDGITKSHLRKDGALHIMCKISNLLLMSRVYPAQWKLNRTTLIPKPGKSVDDVSNWRPITIGSLMGRLHSAMIDKRLRSTMAQSLRQKGFTKEDGCKHNIAILSSALAKMKTEGGGVAIIIDISKAFDTVPHSVMGGCLRKKGVPAAVNQYIKRMYDGCKTKIKSRNDQVIEMNLLRGVKQGDPLSPLLFNLVIEPIIEKIDKTTEGIKLGGENVSILAFADDLVLLAKNKNEAAKQAKMLANYLKELGMSIAASKCAALQIVQTQKTWHMTDPKIEITGSRVPYADPETIIKYLGIEVDPWRGLGRTSIRDITDAAKGISRLALKPHQKVNLIRTYLLPRYIHKLVANPPPLGTLKAVDLEIKREIKKILRLNPTTTDGVIYTSKSHGGLGVQRVENIVKLAKLRNAIAMKLSEDEAVQQALLGQEGIIRKYAAPVGLDWNGEITREQIEAARKALRKAETDRWRQLVSQGQGIKEFFGDKIGNSWLYRPELLKPSRYLDAIKARTNTIGTRVVLNRVKKDMDIKCRRCGVQAETLGHIVGNCTHTKPKRIKRHNEIVNLIKNKVPKESAVFLEPSINVMGDLKKPDMVIKDHEKVYVVDVTVRYEDKENLKQAYREKERKYKDTAENIRVRTKSVRAEVIPIIVGCRGAVPKYTIRNMKVLGLSSKDCLTASLIALRSSLEIINDFIDYDHTL